mmetsp:Transcript_7557/g.17302  ORF Transcript_7557/g.17302 Transcript_7557/m.17302 type:complete len:327 (+) Transcript_7557:603-1583(+)
MFGPFLVCLVQNRLVQDGLHQIFKRHNADVNVERIHIWIAVIHIVDQCQVTAAGLEDVQHLVEVDIGENLGDVFSEEVVQEGAYGNVVVGVDENKLFGVEQPHDFSLVSLVHRNSRVSGLKHFAQSLKGEGFVDLEHIHIFNLGHHVFNSFVAEVNGARHKFGFLQVELTVLGLRVELHQTFELVSTVDGSNFTPEHFIQGAAQRIGKKISCNEKEFDNEDCLCPNVKTVAGADGLGDNLAKCYNQHCRRNETNEAGGKISKCDGQQGVHSNVTDQQRAEQQVATCANRNNFSSILGISLFLLRGVWLLPTRHNNLKADLIQTQET